MPLTDPSIVETLSGRYRGARFRGVQSFLGIRYGSDPSGAGRWRAATAPAPHTGVRDAVSLPAAAHQLDSRLDVGADGAELLSLLYPRGGSPLELGSMTENCLSLNVWAPADSADECLPVMVWFHGGAFIGGTGNEMVFNGQDLASLGRCVVVTVNHRLGLLGFLPLASLLGDGYEHSGNVGLTDLVLALEWVRDNIASFGGDPANVTIFGQSGGGSKVAMLMSAPSATGLFHKAIIQSGVVRLYQDADAGEQFVRAVLVELGLESGQAALLTELPVETILRAQNAVLQGPDGGIRPTVDGVLLPDAPFTPGAALVSPDIPLLVGHTSHDMAMMVLDAPGFAALDHRSLAAKLSDDIPGAPTDLADMYRDHFPDESAQLLYSRALTDRTFGLSATHAADHSAAQGSPVYRYEFGYRTDVLGGILGSCHSLDLAFVFNTVGHIPFAGSQTDRFAVAESMATAWTTFAATGKPSAPGSMAWPEYDASARTTMLIDTSWDLTTAVEPASVADTHIDPIW